MTAFELAVQDASGIAVAQRVRPDRIELAAALPTGGITPSIGLIQAAVAAGLPVHVLVRPRLGGFEYDADERGLVVADVRSALGAGAAGVVVGGTRGGAVDLDLMRHVLDVAGAADVTFHRAFDTVTDRTAALDALVALGVTRVLTSGGRARAVDALDELRALVRHAAGGLQVMAGSGVEPATVAEIATTGVDAVHASAKRNISDMAMLPIGSDAGHGAGSYQTTDEATAVAIRDALRG